MNFVFIWSWFMFSGFLLGVFWGMLLRYSEVSLMVEWLVISVNSFMVEIYILIDWVSVLFSSFVLAISSMVIMYSVSYMEGSRTFSRFFYLVILFVISMLMMIMSPSLISILFGWDMLGLVSYCLVIYYQSIKSFNSGMVTVLTNRIGDVGLLLSIGLLVMNGSWNMYMFEIQGLLSMMYWLLMLAAITKSAQMPFSTWLPLAMAAPTPVSALVHSSTLVTAGVYLIIRFNEFIMMSGVNNMLFYLSILTMIMSGVMAVYEIDLKKIIALSTLSQLGLMMMILSVGVSMLGFYHLLTHAVFKSLLFLCAGVILHVTKDNQDIRFMSGVSSIYPFVTISLYISSLSLMGFPFLSGFYSKDFMMEILYTMGVGSWQMILILVSLSLTVIYSLRLCFYLCFSSSGSIKGMVYLGQESWLMNFSMNLLMFLSVVVGSLLGWLFFYEMYIIYLSLMVKMLTLMFFLMGVISWMGGVVYDLSSSTMVKMAGPFFLLFGVSMWLLNFVHVWASKVVSNMGFILSDVDRVWVEVLEGGSWMKLKVICMKVYYLNYKVYYLLYMLLLLLLITIYLSV